MADWRALYPFASHYFTVEGHRLHYVDEGPRDAPVLLCVHGNPTWSFYWRALVAGLSDSFRVIAIDHLGCGLSDKPQDWPYRLDGHIRNLQALVEQLDLRDVTLAVHDWGGAIGFGVATRVPERFARFVVTNTAAFPVNRIPLRIAVCRVPGLGALGVLGLNGFAQAATVMASEKGLSPAVKAGLTAPYDSWANRIATLRFVEDIPMAPSHPSWGTLTAIDAALPTLRDRPMRILWGEKDWCFSPLFREEWQKRFPDAVVDRYEDVGHYVNEDAPERVVPAVRAWMTARV